jgi:hypothetical protein
MFLEKCATTALCHCESIVAQLARVARCARGDLRRNFCKSPLQYRAADAKVTCQHAVASLARPNIARCNSNIALQHFHSTVLQPEPNNKTRDSNRSRRYLVTQARVQNATHLATFKQQKRSKTRGAEQAAHAHASLRTSELL